MLVAVLQPKGFNQQKFCVRKKNPEADFSFMSKDFSASLIVRAGVRLIR
jgi:hypothetical protein